ncbi:MAG: YhcH/YjgK/YiaL family protein [Bacteroidales bacterium]|nr:YhcH/YjgK/YiaL family protein [Bacteroidales bacterium]
MKRFFLLSLICALVLGGCAQKPTPWNAENAVIDLEVFEQQYALNQAEWDAAFAFLEDPATLELPAGQYPITEKTYAKVLFSDSRTSQNWEVHHHGIDLFYIVSGAELVNLADPATLTDMVSEYNEAKDVELYRNSTAPKAYVLTAGKYLVAFPSDAHQPMLAPDGVPAPMHKIVVKLPFAE